MVTKEVEVRNGLKFKFSVPESVDEYNKVAERGDSAVLDDAIDNNIYRTGLPDAWGMLAEALEKDTNIKKTQKPHPNSERAAKGETVDGETNPAYVDRVAAEQGKTSPKEYQALVDSFGVIPLDLTERRGKGGSLIPKGDLDMAATYMDAGEAKLNKVLDKLAATTGEPRVTLTGDRNADQRAIALQIKAFRTAAAKALGD